MFESALVYLSLMVLMMIFAWIGGKSKNYPFLWAVLASLAWAVVMGIRMHVGIDFDMYYKVYEQNKTGWFGGFGFNRWEPGFQLLYWLCSTQFLHYSIVFGIIAFLQIFLVFYGTRSEKVCWVFLPLTLMFTGAFISYNNIMRHMVAFSIFVCAISFLAERKYWKYLLCIVVAACFHKSALILVVFPLIYMWREEIFVKIWPQLVLLGLSIIIMNIDFVQQIFESISLLMMAFGYEGYMQTEFAEYDTSMGFGIGLVFVLLCNLFIICHSRRIKEYYDNRIVSIMYDMYVIGLCVRLAFLRMFLIQRLNWYFMGYEFIIAALALYYFAKKKDWIYFISWNVMYFAVFLSRLNVKDDGSVLYHAFFE